MEPSHTVSQCIKSKRFVSERETQQKQQFSVLGFKHEQYHRLCDWALNNELHWHIDTLYTYIQDLLPTGQSAFTESTGIFPPTVKVSSLFTNLWNYIAISNWTSVFV